MKIEEAIESLRRFPQGAELIYDGRDVVVALHGYVTNDGRLPMYKLDTPDADLPWLHDASWLKWHKLAL